MEKNKKTAGVHFASLEEIKKNSLLQEEGCVCGEISNKFIVDSSYKNLMLLAPTGSGKGISFVITNLLTWKNSVIIHDIKCENFELTSGYRQRELKQDIFLWKPVASGDGVTHCYNPLDWISRDADTMVSDLQTLIKFLLPDGGDGLQSEARNLLIALIINELTSNGNTNFGKILRLIRDPGLLTNLSNILKNSDNLHPFIRLNVQYFLSKFDDYKSNVLSILSNVLDIWSDPLVDRGTAKSDFSIATFTEKPQTLYIGVEPRDMERLAPLFRMFYQQCTQLIFAHENTTKNRIGTLMVLDEFITLGRMEYFPNRLLYSRGYQLKICIIVENLEQLKHLYDAIEYDQLISNTPEKIIFTNFGYTADWTAEYAGDPLFSREVRELGTFEEIILTPEMNIKCGKCKYYEHPVLKKRIEKPANIKGH